MLEKKKDSLIKTKIRFHEKRAPSSGSSQTFHRNHRLCPQITPCFPIEGGELSCVRSFISCCGSFYPQAEIPRASLTSRTLRWFLEAKRTPPWGQGYVLSSWWERETGSALWQHSHASVNFETDSWGLDEISLEMKVPKASNAMPQDTIILKHDSLRVIFHSDYLSARICWPMKLIFLNPNLVLSSSPLLPLPSDPPQPSSSSTLFFTLICPFTR